MLCSSGMQCSVAVVTAQSHSSSNGIARAAYACSLAVHCGLVLGLQNEMLSSIFVLICCVPTQLSHDFGSSKMSSLFLLLEHVVES